MSFSDKFIKRPVLTTVCSILIVLVGVISIPTLPIANLPNIANPVIQVTSGYSGANAEVTEQAGDALAKELFANDECIEWNRISIFQDVTLKLIASRLLPGERPRQVALPRVRRR